MDYKKIYDALIERGRNRVIEGYSESHHIVPRCMGGTDEADNLVRLTPEEHYVAHQLLVKMYPNNPRLVRAAMFMNGEKIIQKRTTGRKVYGWLRRKFAENQRNFMKGMGKGKLGVNFGKIAINNGEEQRLIFKTDPMPYGWVKGMLPDYLSGRTIAQPGTIWISNGIEEKLIPNTEEIPEGWINSRKRSFERNMNKKNIWITNGHINRRVEPFSEVPEGWRRGRSSGGQKAGELNVNFGLMWITDGVEQKRVPKNSVIPEGWLNTTLIKFEKVQAQEQRVKEFEALPKKIRPEKEAREEKVARLRKLYQIYDEGGFPTVKATGYPFTQQNLIINFHRYLPEYGPVKGYRKNQKKNGG